MEADNNYRPVADAPSLQAPGKLQRFLTMLIKERAICGAVLTIGCYFIGSTYHSRFLGHFHLDSQLFPLDTAGYFVLGARAVFNFCANALGAMNSHPAQTALWGLAVAAYVGGVAWLFGTKPKGSPAIGRRFETVRRWLEKLSEMQRLKGVMLWVLMAVLGLYLILASLLAILLTIGLPAIIGEVAAKADYRDAAKVYELGCRAPGHARCFRLEQDNKPPVEGFLIASSPEQIALYNNGTVSVLPLKGNRLISVNPGTKP